MTRTGGWTCHSRREHKRPGVAPEARRRGLAWLGIWLTNIDADLTEGIHTVGGLMRTPRGEGFVRHVHDDPHPAVASTVDRRR